MNDVKVFAGTPYEPLDLFGGDSIILNRTSKDLRDVTTLVSDFTQPFDLPPSDANNKFFEFYYDTDVSGGFNPHEKVPAYLEVNGVKISEGYIELLSANVNQARPDSYSVVFYAELANMAEAFGEDTLDDLDYSSFEHSLTYANVTGSWDKSLLSGAVLYPLADFERNYVYSTDAGVNDGRNIGDSNYGVLLKELKPALNFSSIFDLIATKYGYSFVFDADVTGVLDNTYMLYHREAGDFINQDLLKDNQFTVTSSTSTIAAGGGYATVDFDTAIVNNNSNFSLANDEFTAFKSGIYTFQLTLTYASSVNLSNSALDVAYLKTSGNYKVTTLNWSFDSYITSNVTFSAKMFSGDTLKIRLRVSGVDMDFLKIQLRLQSVPLGLFNETVDLSQNTPPEFKIIDFVNSAAKMFNFIIEPTDDNEFTFTPLSSWFGAGTQRYYTKYLDTDNYTISKTSVYKSIKFSYEEGTDVASQSFKDGAKRLYGSSQYITDFDFANDDLEVKPLFAPVIPIELLDQDLSGAVTATTGIRLIRMLDKESKPILDAPRVFYCDETIGTADWYLQDGLDASGDPTFETMTEVPLCSIFEDFDATGTTGTLGFGLEEPLSGNMALETLYDRYWGDYIERIFDPNIRVMNCTIILPLNDYLSLRLNDQLEFLGQFWTINNMSYNMTTGKTEFELLQYFPDFVRRRITATDFDGTIDFSSEDLEAGNKDKLLYNLTTTSDGVLNWFTGFGQKTYSLTARKAEPNRPDSDNDLSGNYGTIT